MNTSLATLKPSGIRRINALAAQHPGCIALALGEPDFPTPDVISAEVTAALDRGDTHYPPNNGRPALREALSAYMGDAGLTFSADEVILTDGATEALSATFMAMLNPGDEVLVPAPYWLSYPDMVMLTGAEPVPVLAGPEQGFKVTPAMLEAHTTDKTKLLILNSPSNPTGAVYTEAEFTAIMDWAIARGLVVMADEIYEKIIFDDAVHHHAATFAGEDVLCLTFSGLSKAYRVCGYRAGWVMISGPRHLAGDFLEGLTLLANMRMCSNVPAQSVVQTALGGHQSVNDYIVPGGRVHDQRDLVYDMLNQIPGITAVKPKAAFYIFPKIDVKRFNIHSDEQFALDLLHDKHILISHGGAFNWHGPDHFRVVYLPRMGMLKETIGEIGDFFSTYWQA